MNYEKMSDFEINKAVAKRCGLLIQDIDDSSSLGMTTEFHKNYPSVIWVADFDCSTGQQCEPWWQFDPCNNPSDAWPIIVDSEIVVDPSGHAWSSEFSIGSDKNPLRAAMVVYLMMQEAE